MSIAALTLPVVPSWVKTTYVFDDANAPIVLTSDERHRMRVRYVTITEFPNGEPTSADVEGYVVTKSGAQDKRHIPATGSYEACLAFVAVHESR